MIGAQAVVQGRTLQLRKFTVVGVAIWAPLVVLQALIWASATNLASAGLTLVGGLAGVMYALRRDLLCSMPISTVMVLGYTSYYFLVPPLATLAEGKPLTQNLNHPVWVEVHALVGLATVIVAHWIYRKAMPLQGLRRLIVEKLYVPLGYFAPARNSHLLLMGSVGLAAMAGQVLTGVEAVGGTGSKMIQALYPLAYLPFCILLRGVSPVEARIDTRWLLILAGYSVVLLGVSLGRNSRSAFLLGAMSIAICYGYGLSAGLVSSRWVRPKYLMPIVVLAAGLIGPVADIATSMVIVRSKRADLPPLELLQETLATYGDKEAIRERRLEDQGEQVGWDERYTDNLFVARIANLKYTDNGIDLAMRMDSAARVFVQDMEIQRALSIFPLPVLGVIAPWVDKHAATSASGGDLMLYAVTRDSYVLGGFRTGSLLAMSFAVFGWFYPIPIMALLLLLFSIGDAQSAVVCRDGKRFPVISVMAAATFFTWFYYLTSAATGVESFSDLAGFIVRGWVQVLLVYVLVYWAARAVLGPTTMKGRVA